MRIPLTREQKEAVRERDLRKCVRCGTPGRRKNRLTIHHLIEVSKGGGNEIENLITLCVICHRFVHRRGGCENNPRWFILAKNASHTEM